MRTPIVSLILPTYNVEKWLPEALASIKAQTLTNWEAIFVVDGSLDNSSKFLEEHAANDTRIHVVIQKNQGQGAARNRGVKEANGTFLFFLDPDDMIPPNALEVAVARANETNADIVIGDFHQFIDGDFVEVVSSPAGEPFHQVFDIMPSVFSRKDIHDKTFYYSNYFIVVWMKLFRREAWVANQITAPTGLTMGEDFMTVKKMCFLTKKITSVDAVLVYYRKRQGSATTLRSVKSFDIFPSFHFTHDLYKDMKLSVNEKTLMLNAYVLWFDLHMLHFTPFCHWFSFFRNTQNTLRSIDLQQYDPSCLSPHSMRRIDCAKKPWKLFFWGLFFSIGLICKTIKKLMLQAMHLIRDACSPATHIKMANACNFLAECSSHKRWKYVLSKIKFHLTGR